MSVKVSSKYQVVMPSEARKALGLKPGTQVDVIVKGKVAYIVPIPSADAVQKSLAGKLNLKNVREKKDRI